MFKDTHFVPQKNSTAKNVGGQTPRKQLGSGSRKRKGACVREAGRQSHSNKICKTDQSVEERHFYKHFSLIISNNFRYQPFVAISGNLGEKVLVVDDVLLSHAQEICPTTSLDKNCLEFEFQTDRNYHVDFVILTLMDCIRTSLTFPTMSREPSLNTRGFCIVKCMTMKNVLMRIWTHPCLNNFSQAE